MRKKDRPRVSLRTVCHVSELLLIKKMRKSVRCLLAAFYSLIRFGTSLGSLSAMSFLTHFHLSSFIVLQRLLFQPPRLEESASEAPVSLPGSLSFVPKEPSSRLFSISRSKTVAEGAIYVFFMISYF